MSEDRRVPDPDATQATWAGGDASWGTPPEPRGLPERYADRGLIGRGGMGEVRRVYDAELDRELAMKLLLPTLEPTRSRMARLRMEARLTAGLQHPGIVPVYDSGALPDGRVWFTMKEVRGQTLAQAMAGEWSRRALVARFVQVCQAIAFAHSRSITHRDLKPDNIMLGEFGEVMVMDWGLASFTDPGQLRSGAKGVEGTPAYMAPEQARGEPATPHSDVYALGAVLYALLSGRAPYRGGGMTVLRALLAGPPASLRGRDLPEPLVAVCERAMARQPEERGSVQDLIAGVQDWLDGVQRREQALAVVAEADALRPAIEVRLRRAEALREEAAALLADVLPSSPLARKEPAWELEDAAAEEERQARLTETVWLQTLRSALNLRDDLPEAHERLADHYRRMLEQAEARRDTDAVASSEWLLRQHDRGSHAAYLKGIGALTLVTDPPGALVRLHRYVERRRRLVPELLRELGRTPLVEVPLEPGSYLLTLHREGHEVVRYPVYIERQAHWHGVRPGGSEPTPIWLPEVGALPESVCYVPAGWFIAGGDPDAGDSLERQWVWVDGFGIGKYPVTNAEYLVFLNDLVAQGREAEAERYQPLAGQSTAEGKKPHPSYARSPHFTLSIDEQGRAWKASAPVGQIDWHAAMAFCAWATNQQERRFLLPHELQREKAARGTDARVHPWGNGFDPRFTRMVHSKPGPPEWSTVERFPADESPYGVRGLAGNSRDWCRNRWTREGPVDQGRIQEPSEALRISEDSFVSIRGGSYAGRASSCRAAGRFANRPMVRFASVGLRITLDIDDRTSGPPEQAEHDQGSRSQSVPP